MTTEPAYRTQERIGIRPASGALGAEITGVDPVQSDAGTVLHVLGTIDADGFKRAWMQIGAGENPGNWKFVGQKRKYAIQDGVLGVVPLAEFSGADVWQVVINVDMIELREWQILDESPGLTPVERERDPAIVSQDQSTTVRGVNPQFVDVPVNEGARHDGTERSTLVLADGDPAVQGVDAVLVGGIDADVGVVEGPRRHAALVADRAPRRPAVIGA